MLLGGGESRENCAASAALKVGCIAAPGRYHGLSGECQDRESQLSRDSLAKSLTNKALDGVLEAVGGGCSGGARHVAVREMA